MNSTRLPGKVLEKIGGHSVLAWCVRACRAATGVDRVWVATTDRVEDDKVVEWCMANGVSYYRGSETDVLSRFVGTWEEAGRPQVVLRVTGDEPFIDPSVISSVVRLQKQTGADYCSNIHPRTFADGLDVEAFTSKALLMANEEATRAIDRDTVTYWMMRNQSRLPSASVINSIPSQEGERYVLDTENDLAFCREIADRWGWEKGPPSQFNILEILDAAPELRKLNHHHPANERFFEALGQEEAYERDLSRSKAALEKAEILIPLGAQTFSKSKLQYPSSAPFFVTHGEGAYVYDEDGNDYVDLVSGLLPNILGYRDPCVDQAIRDQLSRGISFSMSTTLETELAARLEKHIPCAEMSRFGKTGTDVTTAAVRLARAYAGRDMILKATNGYHGWASWSTCLDPVRHLGAEGDGGQVGQFPYGDIEAVDRFTKYSRPAAIIVEPETNPEFLRQLRDYCDSNGTVLIFDEIITGFRFGMGGAQKFYGVTPDLACFGKAMGNGMPISALCGKREIMKLMEKVCFSGTFFGETLSLAAAIATIDKLERENVPHYLFNIGAILWNRADALIAKHGLSDHIQLASSHPALVRLTFKDPRIRTLFMESMIEQGVLIIASHNVNYAMKEPELNKIISAYDKTLAHIRCMIDNDGLKDVEAIAPTVRGAA